MLEPIVKRCAGLDVHKMVVVATVLVEQPDGQVSQQTRSFGTFRSDRDALCGWLARLGWSWQSWKVRVIIGKVFMRH